MTVDSGDRTVNGPQGTLHVRVDRAAGAGLPVLLLHSDGGRLEHWDGVVAELLAAEPDHPIARLDARGQGNSEPSADGDYSYRARAADVVAVLDDLGWPAALIVAHSAGNGAAVWLANHQPERVSGLIMVDPPTDPNALPQAARDEMMAGLGGPDSLVYLRAYHRSIAGQDETVIARVLRDDAATTAESRTGMAEALLRWNPARVAAVKIPLFVIGTDGTDGPNAVWRAHDQLASTVVHGTGHWVNIERPGAVLAAISAMLRRVGRS